MGLMPHLTAPLNDLNGNGLCEKPDQPNCWIKHFSQLYGSEVPSDNSAVDILDQMPLLNHLDSCPVISKVMYTLKALKFGKVPGSDDIQPGLLQCGIPHTTVKFHQVKSSCWWEDFIPQDMKDAMLVTLFKNKGLRHDCNKYHAILSSVLSERFFGRVILKGLQELADTMYPKSQCGFRKDWSTIDMVSILQLLQEKRKRAKQTTLWYLLT